MSVHQREGHALPGRLRCGVSSVVEEVLVVEKRWMLREEIHIRKQRTETHQPQQITLRSEEVQVERVPHADEQT